MVTCPYCNSILIKHLSYIMWMHAINSERNHSTTILHL